MYLADTHPQLTDTINNLETRQEELSAIIHNVQV
jgi:hypothetical protein